MRVKEKKRKEVNVDMTVMKIMRGRILPLLALATVALGVIATAYATGAADILVPTSAKTMMVMAEGSLNNPSEITVTLWIDGQVWKKMTLPKGEYTIKTEDGRVIGTIGTVQGPSQAQVEEEFAEAVKIAEADKRVQDIIDGKNYNFTGMTVSHGPEENMAKLRLVVGDESYDITINLDLGIVVSIEPATAGPVQTGG